MSFREFITYLVLSPFLLIALIVGAHLAVLFVALLVLFSPLIFLYYLLKSLVV